MNDECPNCGEELPEDSEKSICPFCGALLTEPCYDIEDNLEFEEEEGDSL